MKLGAPHSGRMRMGCEALSSRHANSKEETVKQTSRQRDKLINRKIEMQTNTDNCSSGGKRLRDTRTHMHMQTEQ